VAGIPQLCRLTGTYQPGRYLHHLNQAHEQWQVCMVDSEVWELAGKMTAAHLSAQVGPRSIPCNHTNQPVTDGVRAMPGFG
jgi:hypothetical protein